MSKEIKDHLGCREIDDNEYVIPESFFASNIFDCLTFLYPPFCSKRMWEKLNNQYRAIVIRDHCQKRYEETFEVKTELDSQY